MERVVRASAEVQPGYELFTGLFVMLVGISVAIGLLVVGAGAVQVMLPLVFVPLGTIHIVFLTDVRQRWRRAARSGHD